MAGIVRNLMVRAVADFSGLQRSMQQAQRDTSNFASGMEKAFSGLKSKLALLTSALIGGEAIKSAISDAIELEATTENLNHILGNSANAYIEWSKTVGLSYGFSQLEAEKYGSSFAHMISLFAHGQADITKKTEQLMKTSAIIANGTGRSIDDVMQRIQSGMLGNVQAINDLGIYANESMLKTSAAYKKIADGKPWAQLTLAQKQAIIYSSLLEQASKQYGDTLQNNVHNKLVVFTASLKNLRVGLGNAMLPILNIVLPALTKFVQMLATGMNYFAAFMSQLFGFKTGTTKAAKETTQHTQAINAQTGSVNKLTKALQGAKSAQMSLAGIDEINTIKSANSAMDGSGGSGVGGGNTPNYDDTKNSANDAATAINNLMAKVKEFADKFLAWLAPLKPYWDDLVTAVGNLGQAVVNLWNSDGFQKLLGWLATAAQFAVGVLIEQIANSMQSWADEIQTIADLLNGDFGKAWEDFKNSANDLYNIFGPFAPLVAGVAAGFVTMKVIETITGMMAAFEIAIIALNAALVGTAEAEAATGIGAIPVIVGLAVAALVALAANWDTVTASVKSFGTWLYSNAILPLGTFIKNISTGLKDIGKTIWGWLTSGWGSVYNWFENNVYFKIVGKTGILTKLSGLGSTIWGYLKSGWGSVYNWVKTNVYNNIVGKNGVLTKLSNLGSTLWGYLTSGWGNISSWFTKNIAAPIHSVFSKITSGLGSTITSGFKAVYNTAVGFINDMIGSLDRMISKIQDINVFGSKPFAGIPMVSSLPLLAKGGIINSPTLAMVGEAGREAVMPLENNTGWINELASKINALNGGNTGNTGPTEVILQLNETTLGKAVIGAINKVHRRGGKVLLNV